MAMAGAGWGVCGRTGITDFSDTFPLAYGELTKTGTEESGTASFRAGLYDPASRGGYGAGYYAHRY